LTDFHNFSCTTSQENAKVIGVKIYYHTFVMLLPYRVKFSDTKVTHFTPILALCTCLYRSHLRKPVSMKQTKHNRKSEAQNLFSKCPPFTRTQAYCVKCVTFMSETFTRYGSNITNVWQEIFTPVLWHSLMKLCTKNYENPSTFVKVTAKKSVALFFWTRCIILYCVPKKAT